MNLSERPEGDGRIKCAGQMLHHESASTTKREGCEFSKDIELENAIICSSIIYTVYSLPHFYTHSPPATTLSFRRIMAILWMWNIALLRRFSSRRF